MEDKDIGYLNVSFKDFSISADENEINIAGYANVAFGDYGELIADRDQETVIPSGIDLKDFNNNPVMLFSHKRDTIVGKFTDVKVDTKGLLVAGTVYKDINPAVFAMVKSGALKTMSIGFRGIDARWDDVNEIFIYTKTVLLEISLVSVPAQPDSLFSVVKSDGSLCFIKGENKKTQGEKKRMNDELLKVLAAFKEELITEVKSLIPEGEKALTDEEMDAVIKEAKEEALSSVSLLKLLEEVELNGENIEQHIVALKGFSTKINSKVTELLGEE